MDSFFPSFAFLDKATTPCSSPPRSLTPLLCVDPDPSQIPTCPPYDPYEEALARSEKEDEEWKILFQNMSRAPTPCRSPPGWRFFADGYLEGSTIGSSRTGYITPKSRSLSPNPRSRSVTRPDLQSAEFDSEPFSDASKSDSEMMQIDEDGFEADDESELAVESEITQYPDDHDIDEEMQGDREFMEKELSPAKLRFINSRLAHFASRTASP